MKYPVQFTYIDNCHGLAVGEVMFLTATEYHEDLADACSQGYDEVFDIQPLVTIPEPF